MSETDFWVEIRRGLITIARALMLRLHWRGLMIVLTGKNEQENRDNA